MFCGRQKVQVGGVEGGDRARVERERGKILHLGDPSDPAGHFNGRGLKGPSLANSKMRRTKVVQATTTEYHSATETRTLLTDTTPSEKARHQGTHAAG